jgi:hypothetical protein
MKNEIEKEFLIPEELMKDESEEIKEFLEIVNLLLQTKTIEERRIFLNELQKELKQSMKGSEEK